MTTLTSTYIQEHPVRVSPPPAAARLEGAIVGAPRILLRAENLAMFGAALFAYAELGAGRLRGERLSCLSARGQGRSTTRPSC